MFYYCRHNDNVQCSCVRPYGLSCPDYNCHKSGQLSSTILLTNYCRVVKSRSGVKYYVIIVGFYPILLNLYRDACTTHMIDRYYSTCFVNEYGLTILKMTSWRDRRTVQLGWVCVQVWTGSLNTSEFTDLVISQTSRVYGVRLTGPLLVEHFV